MEVNMRSSDALVRRAVVLVAELLAVPTSLAVTALVLSGGVLALNLLRAVGVLLMITSGILDHAFAVSIPVARVWNPLVYGSVALASFVALESLGGFAVTRYRRAFEAFDEVRPTTVATVPLLGLTPAGYVLATTGTVELPTWLFAFTALWAHALMYRVIAADMTLGGDASVGVLVGCLAAVPAVVAEVLFVAWHAGRRDTVRRVLAEATAVGIPMNRWVLVLLPLGVTATYGLGYGLRWKHHLGRFRWRPSLTTLHRKIDLRTHRVRLPSQVQSSGPQREATQPRQSPIETIHSEDWIPRSASTVSPAESPGVGEDDDSRLGGGESTEDTGDDRKRSDETTHDDLSDDSETPDDEAITDDVAATGDEEATADDGAATSGATVSPDSEKEGTVTKLYDHSSPVKSVSDTRIYTSDMEGSGESGGDESSVTVCPECARNVPEDDDVRFCARCGAEL